MDVKLTAQEEQELIDDYKNCCFEVTQHLLGLFDVDDDAIDEMVNGHYRSAEGYLHEFNIHYNFTSTLFKVRNCNTFFF